MRVWGMTDTGLQRKENEDAFASSARGGYQMCVVCDGMGGTNGGAVASTIATEEFRCHVMNALHENMSTDQISEVINKALVLVNNAIHEMADEEPKYRKMGTTLVSAICQHSTAVVCNIGDSRCYHITQSGIEQVTKDHSVVESMVENGEITEAEARHHPSRNLITRALGPDMEAKADIFTVNWKSGEYLLLCTDGLVNTVSEQEMLFEVIHVGAPDDCLQRLLEVSKAHGAPDNVTAVLIENDYEEVMA